MARQRESGKLVLSASTDDDDDDDDDDDVSISIQEKRNFEKCAVINDI